MLLYEKQKRYDIRTGELVKECDPTLVRGKWICDYSGLIIDEDDMSWETCPAIEVRFNDISGCEAFWEFIDVEVEGYGQVDIYEFVNNQPSFIYAEARFERLLAAEWICGLQSVYTTDQLTADIGEQLTGLGLSPRLNSEKTLALMYYEARFRVLRKIIAEKLYTPFQLGLTFEED